MNNNVPSWIGKTLNDRYKIEEEIGKGGMSTVFKALDPNLRRHVAVKLIHSHLSEDPEFIQRFEQEATAVAQLRHNNIVQVFDFNNHHGVYYMVMEYVSGEALNKKLNALSQASIRLPLADTIRIVATICDAIDYAHQRRMIHRDLKPANIIINLIGEPILMDFGIAKIVGGMVHTQTGAAIGTADYMSPEQWRGDETDHRADIYALGIILYEMLSGAPPFQGDSTYTLMTQHLTAPVPDIRQVNANTPNSLIAIIEKALAKDRNDRYQTAVEMANALRTAAVHVQSPTDTLAARHLDRLSVLWQGARDLYDDRRYSDCLSKLDELKRADADYKQEQVANLRHEAQNRLYGRAVKFFQAGKLADSAKSVEELRRHAPEYPGLDQLLSQISQGVDLQKTHNRLKQLYEDAVKNLDQHEYQEALQKWETIQQEPGSFEFPDKWQVEKRAKKGLASALYTEALAALGQGQTAHALALWNDVLTHDPTFPDRQQLVAQAEAAQAEKNDKRALYMRLAVAAVVVMALAVVGFLALRDREGAPTVVENTAVPTTIATDVPTAVPATNTPLVVAALPTDTPAPTNTAVPTKTTVPTQTPTDEPEPIAAPTETPEPTATPDGLAVILVDSSLYAAPDADSNEVAIVGADDKVTPIGRSTNSNWLYVRNEDGDEGFIFGERLDWAGDVAALPVKYGTAVVSTPRPTRTETPLVLNLWGLPDTVRCGGGETWYQQIFIEGEGGNGVYTYYWNDEQVGGPTSGSLTFERTGGAGPIIGTGKVVSGSQTQTFELFLPNPDC